MGMRAVALRKGDHRRVAYLSRRKDVFAKQLLLGCPDSRVPFKPLEFQVAAQRAFGVPLTFIKALAGRTLRYGDKNEQPFVMAQTKCKGDHTRTLMAIAAWPRPSARATTLARSTTCSRRPSRYLWASAAFRIGQRAKLLEQSDEGHARKIP